MHLLYEKLMHLNLHVTFPKQMSAYREAISKTTQTITS